MEDLFETMLQLNQVHGGRGARNKKREENLESGALIEALGGEYLPGTRYTREDSAWLDLDHAIAARSTRSVIEELDYDDFRFRGRRDDIDEEENNFNPGTSLDDE